MNKYISLEKQPIAAHLKVSQEFVDNMQVTTGFLSEDWIQDMMTIQFRSFLWGESLGEVILKYPATWWDAFKERWFPRFLMERYPVKYRVFTAHQKLCYPELKLPRLPSERKIFNLIINEITDTEQR